MLLALAGLSVYTAIMPKARADERSLAAGEHIITVHDDGLNITHETIFLIPFLFTCPTCIIVLHIDTFVLQCPLAEALRDRKSVV